jgi:hypothetical protein
MRKRGCRFSARIPRQAFGEDHVHDTDDDRNIEIKMDWLNPKPL